MPTNNSTSLKEALNKSIPLMVRQACHKQNQQLTVRSEPVEGFNQRFLNACALNAA